MNPALQKKAPLVLILALAIFFRFYDLDSIPPGLFIDEATNGSNALEAIETGRFRVFYPENNGREGLFINIQALSLKLFGNEPWALRLVSAIFGTLTVLGMYLLTKELFTYRATSNVKAQMPNQVQSSKSKLWHWDFGIHWSFGFRHLDLQRHTTTATTIGLVAAFLTAVSFWHVNFSRIGFRAISAPFFLVFGFYFLLKALNAINSQTLSSLSHPLYAALSGLCFGLGFHTYIAYRFLAILLPIVLYRAWRNADPLIKKKTLVVAAVCLAATFLAALPIGLYFLEHPQDFFGRAAKVSVFKTPITDSFRGAALTLGMFHIAGDWNWRHNLPGQPLLWAPVGLFFIVGLCICIRQAQAQKKFLPFSLPLWWLAIMLASNFLSAEGAPHALRALVTLPAVFLIAGVGAASLFERLRTLFQNVEARRAHIPLTVFIAWFALLHIGFTGRAYFIFWGRNPAAAEAFSANYLEEGLVAKHLPADMPKYIIVNFGWDDVIVRNLPSAAQTIIFVLGGWNETKWKEHSLRFAREEDLATLAAPMGSLLIPIQNRKETEALIKNRWPHARVVTFRYFTAYHI